jgi:hypothetical protein
MAVAHDNDLQLIETELERAHRGTKDSLTEGALLENFLRENEFPVLLGNGGMCPVTLGMPGGAEVLLENGGMCPVTLQGMPGGAEYYFR